MKKQNVAHLPNAWNPCGPSAGMANNVIASIRNLNQVSIPMQATEKNRITDGTAHAPRCTCPVPGSQCVGLRFLPDTRIAEVVDSA
jgi:hypothetical protein